MDRRAVSWMILMLLLTNVLSSAFSIQSTKAIGIIYIRADGSVDPIYAPIVRNGSLYTLVESITADSDAIVIERDSVVFEGANHTVQHLNPSLGGIGLNLADRTNVTVKNTVIRGYQYCIYLKHSSENAIVGNGLNGDVGIYVSYSSDNNSILNNRVWAWSGIYLLNSTGNSVNGNNITGGGNAGIWVTSNSRNNSLCSNEIVGCQQGIYIWYSNHNQISGNNITENSKGMWLVDSGDNEITDGNTVKRNSQCGIELDGCWNTCISRNNIANNDEGVAIHGTLWGWNNITENIIEYNQIGVNIEVTMKNLICRNNLINNERGIVLYSTNNTIFHNNFINNTMQVYVGGGGLLGTWDDGYPSGGNYWSDYPIKYPDAKEIDDSGIWDTPYVIDKNNTDYYPLMNPHVIPEFPSFLILLLFIMATLLAVVIYKRKHKPITDRG